MKRLNNKAFSLVELLVAFTTITVLSFAIFRTVISIQRRQLINIAYNDYVVFQSSVNNLVQNDFTNKVIEAVEYCGKNCYKIKYIGEIEKTLSINTNDSTLSYGNVSNAVKLKLPKTFTFYRDIEQKDENFTDVEEDRHDSLILFRIPIKSTIVDKDLDIIYIYQFDSRKNPVRPNI
ncbi:MAG: hypothetical protein GX032_01655 [Tenericutes bacterium]|nr:hypothetical protein [Bacilli bacterium]NLV90162.1 hypothetical protein [Mycoplasmatota bacterium]